MNLRVAKVAIVYDRVNKWGGAERVLLALHKIFPHALLFTTLYDKKNASWASVFNIKTSFLQEIKFLRSHHEFIPFLMPMAFENFNFDEYDLVISVTSEFAKAILTKPKTKHICICLTPTRYLWSGHNEYFKNKILDFLTKPLITYLSFFDLIAAFRPDNYIAISNEVKSRIKKYYKRDSKLIYPPVVLKNEVKITRKKDQGYFLVVSRLSRFANYKRVDLAIRACNKLDVPLKIVGSGDIKYFKKMAGKTIEFLGKVDDIKLSNLYKNAKALIFPGFEDFGLVMAEAQSFGIPVIAFKKGGAKEIIKEGITGEFFNDQNIESLIEAILKFNKTSYNINSCIENAKKFSFEKFKEDLINYIKDL